MIFSGRGRGYNLGPGLDGRRGRSSHDFAPRPGRFAPPDWRLAPDAVPYSLRFGNLSGGYVRSAGVTSPALTIDMVAVVRAVHALLSPLDWGGRDAWLAESLKRVRQVLGSPDSGTRVASAAELEALLRVEGDEPGWLQRALDVIELDSAGAKRPEGVIPLLASAPDDELPVVSLRRALAAGLATLQRLQIWRSMLAQVCDDADTGVAIFRSDGLREMARNARWKEMLAAEPERDRLLELVTRQAGHAAASGGSVREDYAELELADRSYQLIARRVIAGTLLPEAGVIVLMDCLSPELPTTRELRVSFGLRGREPQVALLAAEGLTNAEIAQRLRLSAHTVRHYLERVLARLGLHSRKALALHLMATDRQQRNS
jgi:DNA-binding CsgD family transcriptional regulator